MRGAGGRLQDQLRQGPGGACVVREFEVKDYKDTKIKLHFSHFKILVGGNQQRLLCLAHNLTDSTPTRKMLAANFDRS